MLLALLSLVTGLPLTPKQNIVSTAGIVNQGWQTFTFGQRGSESTQSYTFTLAKAALLQITDLYTPGDAFFVYDNNQLSLTTPVPAPDGSLSSTNGDRCYLSDRWSHGETVLPVGAHTLRLFVRAAPNNGGQAALRVDELRVCPTAQGSFFLIENDISWDNVGMACKAYGGQPAKVDMNNVADAFATILGCGVEAGTAWIGAWKGDDYQGQPVSITALAAGQGSAGANNNARQIALLCQPLL